MMKKLYMIRHAKSSWKDISLDDYDRPLNKRGQKNAPFMGKLLKQKGVKPDAILSSPANRAKTTAKLIANEIDYKNYITFDENIYEAGSSTLFFILKELDDGIGTVFLVGHNPELNILAHKLVGFHENIVTSGVLEIEFDSESWAEIDAQNAKLISYEYPKKYIS
jgi:phosphohistidine phosphatase